MIYEWQMTLMKLVKQFGSRCYVFKMCFSKFLGCVCSICGRRLRGWKKILRIWRRNLLTARWRSNGRWTTTWSSRFLMVIGTAVWHTWLVMLRFPNFDFRSISIRFLAQNDDFDSILVTPTLNHSRQNSVTTDAGQSSSKRFIAFTKPAGVC